MKRNRKMKWIALLMAAALVLTTSQSGLVAALAEEETPTEAVDENTGDADADTGSADLEQEDANAEQPANDEGNTLEAAEATESTTSAAVIGAMSYSTLQEAITAAGDTQTTITLEADVTEDITIGSTQNIELVLNDHKITNSSGHTITNKGTLTITGTGTVDNVTHACGALVNYGTAYLNGGTFMRSLEAGKSSSDNGGNSWYTVKNYNQMTVDGATIQNTGAYSSCFANGYQNAGDKTSAETVTGTVTPTLTIKSGAVSGGLNSVKNDDCAILTVDGGSFVNYVQCAFQNHSTETINGGSFTGGQYVIYNCGCDATIDQGILTINGGTFTADETITSYLLCFLSTANTAAVTITGGTFDCGSKSMFGATSGATDNVNISGGYFSKAISTGSSYLATGYTADTNATYDASGNSGNAYYSVHQDTDVNNYTVSWEWTGYTSATATFSCSKCDDEQTVTATVTSVTTDATCEEPGSIVYTASVTFNDVTYTDKKTVVIAATGHNWQTPVWTWASDYTSATAKFTCANLAGETETVSAAVTTSIVAATVDSEGSITYEATVTHDGVEYKDTKTVTIAKLAEETETEAQVAVAETEHEVSATNLTAEEQEAATTAASSVEAVNTTDVENIVADLSESNAAAYADEANVALNKAGVEITDNTTIKVVTEAYLKTDVQSISVKDGSQELVVEISMYYNPVFDS